MVPQPNTPETLFTYAAPKLKVGPGAVDEIVEAYEGPSS